MNNKLLTLHSRHFIFISCNKEKTFFQKKTLFPSPGYDMVRPKHISLKCPSCLGVNKHQLPYMSHSVAQNIIMMTFFCQKGLGNFSFLG